MYELNYYYTIMLLTLFMHACTGMSTAVMLRTALVSVTCVLVVMASLTFIIGFFCGHYLSQRWRKSADRNKQSKSHNMEPDLELKENVAYITLHPTA